MYDIESGLSDAGNDNDCVLSLWVANKSRYKLLSDLYRAEGFTDRAVLISANIMLQKFGHSLFIRSVQVLPIFSKGQYSLLVIFF